MSASKKKFFIRLIFFLIFLIVISYLIFNENGLLKYFKLKSEISQIEQEINTAEENLKALEKEIDSLQTDVNKIEKVARERYNMFKPDEEVLKIQEN